MSWRIAALHPRADLPGEFGVTREGLQEPRSESSHTSGEGHVRRLTGTPSCPFLGDRSHRGEPEGSRAGSVNGGERSIAEWAPAKSEDVDPCVDFVRRASYLNLPGILSSYPPILNTVLKFFAIVRLSLRVATSVFALVCFLFPPVMSGQSADSLGQVPPSQQVASAVPVSVPAPVQWHSMFTRIPGDWARAGRQIFRPSSLSGFLAISGSTGILIATDDATWKWSDRLYQSSTPVQSVSDFFEYLGDGRPQFGLAGAFALYGFVGDDGKALRTGSQLVEAILACGVVIQVLKHTTGRESPIVSTQPGGKWDWLPNQIEYHRHVPKYDAYPSGHIATALATVTVVAENYPEWWWVRPVGYTIVGLIGVSMANTGIHWYSDYPLGLFLGYTFGMIAAHPEQEAASESPTSTLSVGPAVLPSGTGIALTYHF